MPSLPVPDLMRNKRMARWCGSWEYNGASDILKLSNRVVYVFLERNTRLQLWELVDYTSRFIEAAGELTGYLMGEVAFHRAMKSDA